MVKLRRLTVAGFRGVRYPLTLDLTSACRSIAVFGENASGKTSLTDGIEWFFRDRVGHLWREDCKEEALRNVHLGAHEDAIVEIEFNRAELTNRKVLTAPLSAIDTNTDPAFLDYKRRAADERLVLRTADLGDFITKRKGEKRKEIADIIGYEELGKFRDVLVATANSLERDPEYVTAKRNQDSAQAKLLNICGAVLVDPPDFYNKASEFARRFIAEAEICDEASYTACLNQLTQKIAGQEKAALRLQLNEVKGAGIAVATAARATITAQERFLGPYRTLVENREKLKLVNIEHFLTAGRTILAQGFTEGDHCPFCGTAVDLAHLKMEVERRLRDLDAVRVELQATKAARDAWLRDLREVGARSTSLKQKWGTNIPAELEPLVDRVAATAGSLEQSVAQRFERYEEIAIGPETREEALQLAATLDVAMAGLDETLKALEVSSEVEAILETIQALRDLKAAFGEYHENAQVKTRFEAQIRTIARLRDRFVQIQNKAFQDALDAMSEDISRYYLFLHPPAHENVDEVKLRIIGEEGVEFEYSFHGTRTYPPMKYLSESHLNSLGLVLFFASAKLFNTDSRFLVLDDIVTSFDAGHRLRLLRLLQDEFADWQIVLLTHEPQWFDMIKKEVVSAGWLLREVDWSLDNGVQLRPAPADIRALIDLKRSQGHDVANDLRTLLEALLKEVCYALEVKMAFRHNDRNEERMTGELLSELRSTLNRRAADVKDDPILAHLETANLIGTKGSHDRPKEVSKGDIDVALEDIATFEALFRCKKCRMFVTRASFNAPEKKLLCKCGKKQLDWRE